MTEKYVCIDCSFEGKLNSEITYRRNDYICWPCHVKDIRQGYQSKQVNLLLRIAEALELWHLKHPK